MRLIIRDLNGNTLYRADTMTWKAEVIDIDGVLDENEYEIVGQRHRRDPTTNATEAIILTVRRAAWSASVRPYRLASE